VLVDAPGTDIVAPIDSILVAGSSLFFVGSVVWVPLAYAWAVKKWRECKDKKRRAVYFGMILTAAALAMVGPHRHPKVGKWLSARRWRLWNAWMNFIAFEVISDQGQVEDCDGSYDRRDCPGAKVGISSLQKDEHAILAVVPHGLFPFALAFAALPERASQVFGEFKPVVATATALFPFIRTFLGWLGAVDASRDVVDEALSEGARIGLAPGGIGEMFEGYPKPMTNPNDEYATLESRKGFVRMAIKHGVPLVPVYTFGATKMLNRLQLPAIVEKISNLLRISLCIFYGRFGLPIPFRTKLLYVMGRTLYPPVASENSEEFREQVDALHNAFCQEIRRIFERYKVYYGWEDKRLNII